MKDKIIRVSPNVDRAKGLLKTSVRTLKFARSNKLSKDNAGVLFVNYYDSLIELLHSLAWAEGLKVLDHKSFEDIILEKFGRGCAYDFERSRKIRNSAIYYGKDLDLETARDAIMVVEKLIKRLSE